MMAGRECPVLAVQTATGAAHQVPFPFSFFGGGGRGPPLWACRVACRAIRRPVPFQGAEVQANAASALRAHLPLAAGASPSRYSRLNRWAVMYGSGVSACPKQPDGAGHRLRLALVGWWETGRGRHMWRGAELYLPFFRPRRRGHMWRGALSGVRVLVRQEPAGSGGMGRREVIPPPLSEYPAAARRGWTK